MTHVDRDAREASVRLRVRVKRYRFRATTEVWIQREAWMAFTQDLARLDATLQGEARLEGMSPSALSLVVRSLGRSGGIGVEGSIGDGSYDGSVGMTFSVFAFEPSQLATLAREAAAVSEWVGRRDRERTPPRR
jgi:hypothetical protein